MSEGPLKSDIIEPVSSCKYDTNVKLTEIIETFNVSQKELCRKLINIKATERKGYCIFDSENQIQKEVLNDVSKSNKNKLNIMIENDSTISDSLVKKETDDKDLNSQETIKEKESLVKNPLPIAGVLLENELRCKNGESDSTPLDSKMGNVIFMNQMFLEEISSADNLSDTEDEESDDTEIANSKKSKAEENGIESSNGVKQLQKEDSKLPDEAKSTERKEFSSNSNENELQLNESTSTAISSEDVSQMVESAINCEEIIKETNHDCDVSQNGIKNTLNIHENDTGPNDSLQKAEDSQQCEPDQKNIDKNVNEASADTNSKEICQENVKNEFTKEINEEMKKSDCDDEKILKNGEKTEEMSTNSPSQKSEDSPEAACKENGLTDINKEAPTNLDSNEITQKTEEVPQTEPNELTKTVINQNSLKSEEDNEIILKNEEQTPTTESESTSEEILLSINDLCLEMELNTMYTQECEKNVQSCKETNQDVVEPYNGDRDNHKIEEISEDIAKIDQLINEIENGLCKESPSQASETISESPKCNDVTSVNDDQVQETETHLNGGIETSLIDDNPKIENVERQSGSEDLKGEVALLNETKSPCDEVETSLPLEEKKADINEVLKIEEPSLEMIDQTVEEKEDDQNLNNEVLKIEKTPLETTPDERIDQEVSAVEEKSENLPETQKLLQSPPTEENDVIPKVPEQESQILETSQETKDHNVNTVEEKSVDHPVSQDDSNISKELLESPPTEERNLISEVGEQESQNVFINEEPIQNNQNEVDNISTVSEENRKSVQRTSSLEDVDDSISNIINTDEETEENSHENADEIVLLVHESSETTDEYLTPEDQNLIEADKKLDVTDLNEVISNQNINESNKKVGESVPTEDPVLKKPNIIEDLVNDLNKAIESSQDDKSVPLISKFEDNSGKTSLEVDLQEVQNVLNTKKDLLFNKNEDLLPEISEKTSTSEEVQLEVQSTPKINEALNTPIEAKCSQDIKNDITPENSETIHSPPLTTQDKLTLEDPNEANCNQDDTIPESIEKIDSTSKTEQDDLSINNKMTLPTPEKLKCDQNVSEDISTSESCDKTDSSPKMKQDDVSITKIDNDLALETPDDVKCSQNINNDDSPSETTEKNDSSPKTEQDDLSITKIDKEWTLKIPDDVQISQHTNNEDTLPGSCIKIDPSTEMEQDALDMSKTETEISFLSTNEVQMIKNTNEDNTILENCNKSNFSSETEPNGFNVTKDKEMSLEEAKCNDSTPETEQRDQNSTESNKDAALNIPNEVNCNQNINNDNTPPKSTEKVDSSSKIEEDTLNFTKINMEMVLQTPDEAKCSQNIDSSQKIEQDKSHTENNKESPPLSPIEAKTNQIANDRNDQNMSTCDIEILTSETLPVEKSPLTTEESIEETPQLAPAKSGDNSKAIELPQTKQPSESTSAESGDDAKPQLTSGNSSSLIKSSETTSESDDTKSDSIATETTSKSGNDANVDSPIIAPLFHSFKPDDDIRNKIKMQLNLLRNNKKVITKEESLPSTSTPKAEIDEKEKQTSPPKLNEVLISNESEHVIVSVVGGYISEHEEKQVQVKSDTKLSITERLLQKNRKSKKDERTPTPTKTPTLKTSITPQKTKDITKIKGWRSKNFSLDEEKEMELETPIEDFKRYINFDEPSTSTGVTSTDVTEDILKQGEKTVDPKSAFISDVLDSFLSNNAQLQISYEIPKLKAEEAISKPSDLPVVAPVEKSEERPKKVAIGGYKPKTLAEKRKMLEMEKKITIPTVNYVAKLKKQSTSDKTVMDHFIKNNFPFNKSCWDLATTSEPNQYVIVNGERIKIMGGYGGNIFINERVNKPVSKGRCRGPAKQAPCRTGSCRAGPLSFKLKALKAQTKNFEYKVLKMPKIKLVIYPEVGKPLPYIAEQYLSLCKRDDCLSETYARFAVSALKEEEKESVVNEKELKREGVRLEFELPYAHNANKILLKKVIKAPKLENVDKYPASTVDREIKNVMSEMIDCITNRELDVIKTDPHLRKVGEADLSPVDKINKEDDIDLNQTVIKQRNHKKSRTTLELRRLNVQVIEVDVEDSPTKEKTHCSNAFCKLGCICNSLQGNGKIPDHCGREACMFECTCANEPNKHSVKLPAGTDLLSASTMVRLKDEAVKHLAKVEKEFTQTVIKANNQTIVVGGARERQRRVPKVPKKFDDFIKTHEENKAQEVEGNVAGKVAATATFQKISLWKTEKTEEEKLIEKAKRARPFIRLQKLNLGNVLPYCMVHNLYKCYCGGKPELPKEPLKNVEYITYSSRSRKIPKEVTEAKVCARTRMVNSEVMKKPETRSHKRSFELEGNELLVTRQSSRLMRKRERLNYSLDYSSDDSESNLPLKRLEKRNSLLLKRNSVDSAPVFASNNLKVTSEPMALPEAPKLSVRSDLMGDRRIAAVARDAASAPKPGLQKDRVASLIDYENSFYGLIIPTDEWKVTFQKMLNLNPSTVSHIRLLQWPILVSRYASNAIQVWLSAKNTYSNVVLTENKRRPSRFHMNIKMFGLPIVNLKVPNIVNCLMSNTLPGKCKNANETYMILVNCGIDWEARGTILLNNIENLIKERLNHRPAPNYLLQETFNEEFNRTIYIYNSNKLSADFVQDAVSKTLLPSKKASPEKKASPLKKRKSEDGDRREVKLQRTENSNVVFSNSSMIIEKVSSDDTRGTPLKAAFEQRFQKEDNVKHSANERGAIVPLGVPKGSGKSLLERRALDKGSLVKRVEGGLIKRGLERGEVQTIGLGRYSFERGTFEKESLERGALQKEELEKGAFERVALKSGALQTRGLEKGAFGKVEVEKGALGRGELEMGALLKGASVRETPETRKALQKIAPKGRELQKGTPESRSLEGRTLQGGVPEKAVLDRDTRKEANEKRSSTNRPQEKRTLLQKGAHLSASGKGVPVDPLSAAGKGAPVDPLSVVEKGAPTGAPSSEDQFTKILSSLPTGAEQFHWFMLKLENDFSVLKITTTNFFIKYMHLISAVQMARKNQKTVRIRTLDKENIHHVNYGIYAIPDFNDRVFFGPYLTEKEHYLETFRYANGKLISTKAYNIMRGTTGKIISGMWFTQKSIIEDEKPKEEKDVAFVDLTEDDDEVKAPPLKVQDPLFNILAADFTKQLANDVTIEKIPKEKSKLLTPTKNNKRKVIDLDSSPEQMSVEVVKAPEKKSKELPPLYPLNVLNKNKKLITSPKMTSILKPITVMYLTSNIDDLGYFDILSCDNSIQIPGLAFDENNAAKKFVTVRGAIEWLDGFLKEKICHVPPILDLGLKLWKNKDPPHIPKFNDDCLNGFHMICTRGLFGVYQVKAPFLKERGFSDVEITDMLYHKFNILIKKNVRMLGTILFDKDADKIEDYEILAMAPQKIKELTALQDELIQKKKALVHEQKLKVTKLKTLIDGLSTEESNRVKTNLGDILTKQFSKVTLQTIEKTVLPNENTSTVNSVSSVKFKLMNNSNNSYFVPMSGNDDNLNDVSVISDEPEVVDLTDS